MLKKLVRPPYVFVVLGVLFLTGFYFYSLYDQGRKATPSSTDSPETAQKIYSIDGVVLAIYDTTLDVEITNPQEPNKKELRFAILTGETEVLVADGNSRDKYGLPMEKKVSPETISISDRVILTGAEDLRDSKKVAVSKLVIIKN